MPLGGIWAEAWKKPETKPKIQGKRARHSATKEATPYIYMVGSKRSAKLSSYWGGNTSRRCCVWRLTRCSCGQFSQRVKKLLASKLHVHSVNFAAKLVHTSCALSSTDINSHQEPVSGQACNPLDPHDFWFFFSFSRWGALRYLVPKWLLSLNCGE